MRAQPVFIHELAAKLYEGDKHEIQLNSAAFPELFLILSAKGALPSSSDSCLQNQLGSPKRNS